MEATKAKADAKSAQLDADNAVADAEAAIDFAFGAVEEAEYAVLNATLAQMEATPRRRTDGRCESLKGGAIPWYVAWGGGAREPSTPRHVGPAHNPDRVDV